MTTDTQQPYKILVVDDEPDVEPLVLQRMRRQIRAGKYSFVFAQNGVEAMARLRNESDIDMVLSDINMPQMDGLTLLEQISKLDPELRAVIISAYGDMKNIRTAMNRGAFDFVTKPIDFEDLEVTIERTLANIVQWREALASRDKLVAIQNELDVASEMQQSILPVHFPSSRSYQVYASMDPARSVGGDFFDVVRLDNNRIGLAIADVSGKGVPAALFMMSARTLLKGAAIGTLEPKSVLDEVNNLLQEDNESSMFVTVLYAVYNPESGQLTIANGGHNPPLVVRKDGTSELLTLSSGLALGLLPDYEFEEIVTRLEPGETVVLYTDGVTEAMNSVDEEFGNERLLNLFAGAPPTNAQQASDAVFAAVRSFAGGTPQSDDITCLILSVGEFGQ